LESTQDEWPPDQAREEQEQIKIKSRAGTTITGTSSREKADKAREAAKAKRGEMRQNAHIGGLRRT
jgi:hypothetical protein